MTTVGDLSWDIECYARYKKPEGTNPDGPNEEPVEVTDAWKLFYSTTTEQIRLSLETSCHLVLTQSCTILESHSVVGGALDMTVHYLGDSMLFTHKSAENCVRRFRLKFSSCKGRTGEESCLNCVMVLSKIFVVKQLSNKQTDDSTKGFETITVRPSTAIGEVTLDKVAKILMNRDPMQLSAAYRNSQLPAQNIGRFLQLCLSDPTFPAFVEQVEKHIHNLTG